MAEQIEVGILDRHAFADPGALPDSRRVAQVVERHLEDLLDFVRRRRKSGRRSVNADDRMQRKAADEHVNRRELAEDAHGRRIDADFFGRFAQRRLARAFRRDRWRRPARLICPGCCARPLARTVSATAAPVSCGIQQQQRGGLSRLGGDLPRAPRVACSSSGAKRICASIPGSVCARRSRSIASISS